MRNLAKLYRFETLLLLTFTVLFCFSLSLFRAAFTGSMMYLFLDWNLFLAVVPYFLSSYMVANRASINRYTFFLLAMSWLLFFPNSPYILTDLFHLQVRDGMPKWFDLILILAFAWAGLLFGFMSLFQIEKILGEKVSQIHTNFIIVVLLFISSFGVYLGRFLRWNSWDIFSNPVDVFSDIIDRFIHPLSHGRTWGITLMLGTLLCLIYFSIKIGMRAKVR